MSATEHPFAYLKQRADLKKCCADVRNLHVVNPQPGLHIALCTRCGRKHRKLFCEPGTILARGFEAMAAQKRLIE